MISLPYIVPIEGGLGAQLLSYALYKHLIQQGKLVKLDLSYFSQQEKVASEGEGISIWPFLLDNYNLEINHLPIASLSEIKILKLLTKKRISKRYLFDGSDHRFKLNFEAFSKLPKLNELALLSDHDAEINLLTNGVEEFSIIHIRRGDYLNVATHLVSINDINAAIKKHPNFLSHKTLILSDGKINLNELKFVRPVDAVIINEENPIILHELMKRSASLIISNSQFSYSAALLSCKKKVLMPKRFFGDNALNEIIFKQPEWEYY